MAHSKRSNRKFSFVGVLFGGVFFFMGSAFMWSMGLQPIVRSIQSGGWPQVACTVAHSELIVKSDDDGTTYKPKIRVSYYYSGQNYTGGNYSFNVNSSRGRKAKAAVVNGHPVGKQTQCWVNPADPYEAVIDRSILGMVGFVIPFSSIFVVIGGAIMATGLGLVPARWSLSRKHNRVSGSSTGHTVLKPRVSAGSKILTLTFMAVLWNGMIGVLFLKEGFVLFFIPFLLVGVGIIGFWAKAILSLTNPKPVVSLSEGSPRVGQSVTLEWHFTGNANRITDFSIVIEACEKATYRVGTDTRTDTHVFYKNELLNVLRVEETMVQSLSLQIPMEAMHSFSSRHNKIEWQIKVRGNIPNWANVVVDYPIVIQPV